MHQTIEEVNGGMDFNIKVDAKIKKEELFRQFNEALETTLYPKDFLEKMIGLSFVFNSEK